MADFISRNPVRVGVHWACNMDVSLRVVCWLAALSFFQGSRALDRWWSIFCRLFVAHRRFITSHLEFGTLDGTIVTSNHFLADVFGLHRLASIFPVWMPGSYGGAAPSGVSSPSASARSQRTAARSSTRPAPPTIVSCSRCFCRPGRCRYTVVTHCPTSSARRLTAGLEFLAQLRQQLGHIAQIGDADNGRAHIFTRYATWEPGSADWLLAAGAHVLGRPDLAEGVVGTARMEPLFWGPPGKAEEVPVGRVPAGARSGVFPPAAWP